MAAAALLRRRRCSFVLSILGLDCCWGRVWYRNRGWGWRVAHRGDEPWNVERDLLEGDDTSASSEEQDNQADDPSV